jgi:adenosylmethionine-8-amino-7-oxononanoate aminotransferase
LFALLDEKIAPHPFVGEVRGKGLLAGIELVADRETTQPFDPAQQVTQSLLNAALARGIMLYPCASGDGVHSDQVLLSPPLTVSASDIDAIVDRLALALRDIEPVLVNASNSTKTASR